MKLTGTGLIALVGLVALAAAGVFVYFKGWPAIKKTVTETLNPASDKNIVYQGANAVVTAVIGHDESVGGYVADAIFKLTHPGFDILAPTPRTVSPTLTPPQVADPALAPESNFWYGAP